MATGRAFARRRDLCSRTSRCFQPEGKRPPWPHIAPRPEGEATMAARHDVAGRKGHRGCTPSRGWKEGPPWPLVALSTEGEVTVAARCTTARKRGRGRHCSVTKRRGRRCATSRCQKARQLFPHAVHFCGGESAIAARHTVGAYSTFPGMQEATVAALCAVTVSGCTLCRHWKTRSHRGCMLLFYQKARS